MTAPRTHSFPTPAVRTNRGFRTKIRQFITVLRLTAIYNLRIDNPVDEICLSADNITAAFRCLLYHPDMAVLWATVFQEFWVIPWCMIFGGKNSLSFLHDSRGAPGPSCFCWGLLRCLYRTFGNHHLVNPAHSSQSRSNDTRHY